MLKRKWKDRFTCSGNMAILYVVLFVLPACAANSPKSIDIGSEVLESDLTDLAKKHFVTQTKIPEEEPSSTIPASKKASDYPLFSVSLSDVPVKEFIGALAKDADLELVISGTLSGKVSLVMNNRPLRFILDSIAEQLPLRYVLHDSYLQVFEDRAYIQTYQVDYLNISRTSASDIDLSTQIDSISLSSDGNESSSAGGNNSKASIKNHTENQFWESLKNNLLALIGEPMEQQQDAPSSIIINRETGVVIVRARYRIQQEVARFLDQVVSSAQKQVLIEALVVEINLREEFQAGVDWRVVSNGSGSSNFVQNFSASPVVTRESISEIASPSAILSVFKNSVSGTDITATLSLLEKFGDVKILSSPKINALNNQAAVLKVVDNRVYFSIGVQRVTTNETLEKLTTTSEIRTVPIGLVMNVIPYIGQGGEIILNVRPTISRILGFVTDPNPDLAAIGMRNLVPEIQVREMESILRVKNGGLVIIGGLMQERVNNQLIGIPVLSRIPLLGRLFQYQEEKKEKTELLVFLRPVIIEDGSISSRACHQLLNTSCYD